VNDFTRGYASHVVEAALTGHDASIIMSGGTEGVLCPHFLVFAEHPDSAAAVATAEGRLVMGAAKTRRFEPHELGRRAQVLATRDAVLQACEDAGLPPQDIRFAQIKCPLLTPERIARSSSPVATQDGYVSMGLSRAASALGVALATGEVDASHVEALSPEESAFDPALYSGVASASAGIELEHSEIFVLGNAAGSSSSLRAVTCVMQDAIDARSVGQMLSSAGLPMKHGQLTPDAQSRVRAVLAKADPCAEVRGERTTMCSDSDIHATRHSRAAVGGLLCGIFGDTTLYVSGGAELQGPAGGGPVCVIYEVA
jgi:cyanuric acid amidohydrolase